MLRGHLLLLKLFCIWATVVVGLVSRWILLDCTTFIAASVFARDHLRRWIVVLVGREVVAWCWWLLNSHLPFFYFLCWGMFMVLNILVDVLRKLAMRIQFRGHHHFTIDTGSRTFLLVLRLIVNIVIRNWHCCRLRLWKRGQDLIGTARVTIILKLMLIHSKICWWAASWLLTWGEHIWHRMLMFRLKLTCA